MWQFWEGARYRPTEMCIYMVVAEWWSHIWARGRQQGGLGCSAPCRGPLTGGELTTAHVNKAHVINIADQVENEAGGTILE